VNPAALITGASRGIGRGIALELARTGFDLLINYAGNEAAARQTAADCVAVSTERGGPELRVEIFQADIARTDDRRALIDFARQRFGRLDLLVNNAGVAPLVRADLLEVTEESFDRLMSINARGAFFLTQSAASWMIEQARGSSPGIFRPKIVTISSISAYTASVTRGDYCMAKAALSMLTPLFAARLAEHGIGVYEIRPGIIASDMTETVKEKYNRWIAEGGTPITRWGTPEDVGRAVAAIARDHFPFSTGEVFNVDGGFHLRRL
jgi:3-oxoacyl-[acyl-carrier protein] reductase